MAEASQEDKAALQEAVELLEQIRPRGELGCRGGGFLVGCTAGEAEAGHLVPLGAASGQGEEGEWLSPEVQVATAASAEADAQAQGGDGSWARGTGEGGPGSTLLLAAMEAKGQGGDRCGWLGAHRQVIAAGAGEKKRERAGLFLYSIYIYICIYVHVYIYIYMYIILYYIILYYIILYISTCVYIYTCISVYNTCVDIYTY